MTRIYLIRHAEAEGNYYRRVQGHYNSRITFRGRLQIEALAERFRAVQIDALYSSDLRRTMETAGSILKYHNLTLNTDERLREFNMGEWEDVPWGNAAFDAPDQMLHFALNPEKFSLPGSENYRDLQNRIAGAIKDIAARHDGQTIAIVSHGMAIRSFICLINNIPSERVSEVHHGDNTCVALLEYEDGNFKIEYYNDNSHLSDETSTFANQSWWRSAKDKPDTANLRFIPMDLAEDSKLYINCYADSWKNTYRDLKTFNADNYLKSAKKVSKKNPLCLVKAYSGDEFAGIVELDPDKMSEQGAGWISLFYLLPEYRETGFGPQLLGHSVSFFRAQGRGKLRLHVSEKNEGAIRFYRREGFIKLREDEGISNKLYLMEMQI